MTTLSSGNKPSFSGGQMKVFTQMLSLEDNQMQNMMSIYKNVLMSETGALTSGSNSLANILSLFTGLGGSVKSTLSIFSDKKTALAKVSYLDFSSNLVSVPEGFKGDLAEYITFLITSYQSVSTKTTLLAKELSSDVSLYISNPTMRMASVIPNSTLKEYLVLDDAISNAYVTMGVFKPNGTMSRIRLKEICPNSAALVAVFSAIESVNFKTMESGIGSHLKESNKCAALLAELADGVTKGDYQNVSGGVANMLSRKARTVAEGLTLISLLFFELKLAVESAKGIIETVT